MGSASLLESLKTADTDAVIAGAESRLDDMSSASSMLTMGRDIVGNHPTMGTCGCPMPPAPNTPPSPCGC